MSSLIKIDSILAFLIEFYNQNVLKHQTLLHITVDTADLSWNSD